MSRYCFRPTLAILAAYLLAHLCAELIGEIAANRRHPTTVLAQTKSSQQRSKNYGRTPPNMVPYGKSPEPYRHFFLVPPLHRGPGRDVPEPDSLKSVHIGLLAPLKGTKADPAGRNLKRGVELALKDANSSGGYRGIPFELRPVNDQALWGASSNSLVQMAYRDKDWAVIGSPDSTSTHVALRVALKAEVMIVNVGASDPTLTETGIPWILRCTPDDRQTGYRLAQLLFEENQFSRVAVLRSKDRYGRFGVKEFKDAARRLMRPLPMEVQFLSGQGDFSHQLQRISEVRIEAVVLWTKAREAALIVRQMRERGMSQPVFGTDRLVSQEFLEVAGMAAEGVTATFWMDPGSKDERWQTFRHRFIIEFGAEPGPLAAYGYDAARLVVDAVRHAGLNRVRIRDALTNLRSYQGVVGNVQLNVTSNNISPLVIARIQGGRFVFR